MKQILSDETVERLHVDRGWSRAAIRTVEDAIMLAVVKERESAKYTEAEGDAFADGYFTAIHEVGMDAERYRKLRAMTWDVSPLGVVSNPRQAVKLGHDCPMGERLDAMLDALPAPPPARCPACGYQHGHAIGCVNNPVDLRLKGIL